MELFDAITRRHSYRGSFTDQPVDKNDLIKIVEAGLAAPSGKNEQTTDFVIIDDPEKVAQIAEMHDVNKAFQQAKAFIACIVDKDPQPVFEGLSFQIEDCSAAVENMLLAITSLGYASVWVDGWIRREGRNEKIGQLINLPDSKVVRIILPIGVPTETKAQPAKKSFDQRAWFNQYKG